MVPFPPSPSAWLAAPPPDTPGDSVSHLRARGSCYFCLTELSLSKLEGDTSSLIGKFKRPLSHSAASGMCN